MGSLVSVLIPCYNGEGFLPSCFNCLLEQTYKNVEVVFVNDGSKDNSEKLAKEYGKQLEEKGYIFKYFYQENAGAAAAINFALKKLTGKYIMLYDVDDIIMPTSIEDKALFLDNHEDYDMVRNNGYFVNISDLNNNLKLFTTREEEKNNEHIFEDIILERTNNWPSTFMVRTDALFAHIPNKNIYESRFGQNLQIMLPVAYFGKSGFIDKPLMKYVKHDNSHSANTSYEREMELSDGYEENRVAVINMLDIDESIKKKYIDMIRKRFIKRRMYTSLTYDKKDVLKKEYKALKKVNFATKKDTIYYYAGITGVIKLREPIKKILGRK